jgi:hypothetical protein
MYIKLQATGRRYITGTYLVSMKCEKYIVKVSAEHWE